MQIPYTVINTREEFKHTIMNSTSEIIFVDTAGRSQKNNLGLAEMRNILDGVKTNLDIQLVISATTKYRDALDIMTRFNQLMYNKVIITKLDETNTIGSLLSIMNPEKKLSYFTTGQGVPDDIEIAEKEKLLDMIVFEELRAG
jgi:flagellar biosynthesis protein FlhF